MSKQDATTEPYRIGSGAVSRHTWTGPGGALANTAVLFDGPGFIGGPRRLPWTPLHVHHFRTAL